MQRSLPSHFQTILSAIYGLQFYLVDAQRGYVRPDLP